MSDPVPVKMIIQIRWRDLDALGHVNNAVYLTYFELARLAYVRALLGDDAPRDRRTPAAGRFSIHPGRGDMPLPLAGHAGRPACGDDLGRRWDGKASCSSTGSTTRSRGGWWPRVAAPRYGSITRRTRAGRYRRDRGADGGLAGRADPTGVRHPQDQDRNASTETCHSHLRPQFIDQRPRPHAASPPASPWPCRTPRRGAAPFRRRRSPRRAPTADPPALHRPRRRGCARLPGAVRPSPAPPAGQQQTTAPRVRQTTGAETLPGSGDRPVGASAATCSSSLDTGWPRPGLLPRCWA